MEPRIQYAKTSDGVSVAFWAMGDGPPLVYMPDIPFSNIQIEWLNPAYRRWYERLAQTRTLIRYDGRGIGMSQREVTDLSLDAQVLDMDAVVQHLRLERCALFAQHHGGPIAITYAARQAERVSHLLLWNSYARGSEPEWVRGLGALVDNEWGVYTETIAHTLVGWSDSRTARWYARLIRESISPEVLEASWAAIRRFDVTSLLPQLSMPTLVLHHHGYTLIDEGWARDLASRIPNARLSIVQGSGAGVFVDGGEPLRRAFDEFLGERDEAATTAEPAAPGAFRTILFTDVESHTQMMQRLGDARGREVLREHERITRETLARHGGTEVKAMGDGFMASFGSTQKALECAVALQRSFSAHNESAAEPLSVRVGINAGEPIAEQDDLFGASVITASRICAQASGGEIVASDVVRQLVAGKGFSFAERGAVALKGFEEPVRIFEVSWRE